MRVIDVHTHYVPESFPPCPSESNLGWPSMHMTENGDAEMIIDGKPFRLFERFYWDIPRRVAEMDAQGIDIQVMSPLPELLGYWLERDAGCALAEHMNRSIALAAAQAPDRLVGVGMIPLVDPKRSTGMIAEVAGLGLRGVLMASNVNGISLADARFRPVFAEIERYDLAAFVHGYRPAGLDRLIGSPLLGPIIGVPGDCAAVVASFIMTDILGAFPALKLCFMHGGGTFGAVLARMDHVWRAFPAMQTTNPLPPIEYAGRFFYDSVTFGAPYLRYLIDMVGANAVAAGSDGPTHFGQLGLEGFVREACSGDADIMARILSDNAARLLNLESN